ncbi:hypothetical protein AHAS_Ahas11G0189500 [Arachis hypogaea]
MKNWNEKECNDEAKLLSIIKDDLMEDEEVCILINEYTVKYICKEPRKTSEQTRFMGLRNFKRSSYSML